MITKNTISFICSLGIFLILMACGGEPAKTESMLRLEEAQHQAQLLVDKANALLKNKVMHSPKQNLDSLIIAKKVSEEAINVYAKANIRDWTHPELTLLRQNILALQPELAAYAIDLLIQTTDKTTALNQRLEEIKTIPIGGNNMGTDKMVEYLSKNYNAEIADCCLVSVTRISEILMMSPDKYAELIKLSRYIYFELGKVVSDPQKGVELLARLNKLKASNT
ncbi:hypothetical protein ACVCDT_10840 [Paraglaciecola aestuariivivens]